MTALVARLPSPLLLAAFLIAALTAMPVVSVAWNLLESQGGSTWQHLASTVLPEYIFNSLALCVGVGLGVAFMGVGAAWLVAMYRFPGRRVFEWALILPLAMPAYVLAYLYTDLLQFVGPVQTALRETFGWEAGDYFFPDIRTLPGAMGVFVLVLYPYVYLLARTAFLERAGGMMEAARTLGMGPWRAFWKVSLPLVRPAVAAGVALALMETLADYGTVAYFAVPTFTTGIYRAWFSLGDRIASAQLASVLLGFVLLLVLLERASRGRARYHDTSHRRQPAAPQLRGLAAWAATLGCMLPLGLGFLLPAGLLLHMAWNVGDAQFGTRFLVLARNSFTLAGTTALLAVGLALLLAYCARLFRRAGAAAWLAKGLNSLVRMGYAVPGTVIAVGVLIPVTRLDNWLAAQWQAWFGVSPGLLFTGTTVALVYAYLARFLSVALQTAEAGLARITFSMDDAARSLGLGQAGILRQVHVPVLRGSLLTASLLVFVDVMKELPATLVMRPFNFDTLATQTYSLAADERLAEASTAALAIVVVGLLPLIVLSRQIAASRK